MTQFGLPASRHSCVTDIAMSWWDEACRTARGLRAGNAPARSEIWGPILDPTEDGRMVAELEYSRLYGGDGTYRHNNLFAFGSTEFVLGALGVNALLNEARKSEARRRAAVQWRDRQMSSVVVTSKRLWCGVNNGRRLEFALSMVNEFIPDLDKDLLTFPWVWFHAARPGSAGQSPPRVSMAMPISASGL